MDKTRLINLFILTGLFISMTFICNCNLSHKYYYIEDGQEEILIEAISDSAAYLCAISKFEISKKVHEDIKSSLGETYSTKPVAFKLLNEAKEDITYKVNFEDQENLKKRIREDIQSLPSNIEKDTKNVTYDTIGLYLAPVVITNAKYVRKEYSSYKDVKLTFKNVSSKPISAIRFKWYGENAFNEPADMGIVKGWGSGFTDDNLNPGAIGNGVWNASSSDGKKILIAYPYEVAYQDGSIWKLKTD